MERPNISLMRGKYKGHKSSCFRFFRPTFLVVVVIRHLEVEYLQQGSRRPRVYRLQSKSGRRKAKLVAIYRFLPVLQKEKIREVKSGKEIRNIPQKSHKAAERELKPLHMHVQDPASLQRGANIKK